jgi:hypothetical protein
MSTTKADIKRIETCYHYPKVVCVTEKNPSRRYYMHGDSDDRYWSITTITSGTMPKNELMGYKIKQIFSGILQHFAPDIEYSNTLSTNYRKFKNYFKRPDYVELDYKGNIGDVFTDVRNSMNKDSESKAELGSLAHDAIARYLQNKDIEDDMNNAPKEVIQSIKNFQSWQANEGKEFIFDPDEVEVTIFHKDAPYAGTADAMAVYTTQDNKFERVIIDWKTGYVGQEAFFQVAALAGAYNSWKADPKNHIKKAFVVQLPRETTGYTIHEVDNIQELYTTFLHAADFFDNLQILRDDSKRRL